MRPYMTKLASTVTAVLMSGCTFGMPFRGALSEAGSGVTPSPDTVVVAVTHAVLRPDRAARSSFWSYVRTVGDTLPDQPGFVGYSLRRTLLGGEGWTLTVWRDDASLDAFATHPIHLAAIRESGDALESFRSARIELPAAEIPLSWGRALQLFEERTGSVE
jgi:hypothetical protein